MYSCGTDYRISFESLRLVVQAVFKLAPCHPIGLPSQSEEIYHRLNILIDVRLIPTTLFNLFFNLMSLFINQIQPMNLKAEIYYIILLLNQLDWD
jgi:hypothetical protein